MTTKKNLKKLNHEILDMTFSSSVKVIQIDIDTYAITTDDRHAIIFRREECLLDINNLLDKYGEMPVLLNPRKRVFYDLETNI